MAEVGPTHRAFVTLGEPKGETIEAALAEEDAVVVLAHAAAAPR
jgi:hypothetical protein